MEGAGEGGGKVGEVCGGGLGGGCWRGESGGLGSGSSRVRCARIRLNSLWPNLLLQLTAAYQADVFAQVWWRDAAEAHLLTEGVAALGAWGHSLGAWGRSLWCMGAAAWVHGAEVIVRCGSGARMAHAWLHAWLHRRRHRCSRQCCAHGVAPRVRGDFSFGLGDISPPPRLACRAGRQARDRKRLPLVLLLLLLLRVVVLVLTSPVLLLASGSHSRVGPAEATSGVAGGAAGRWGGGAARRQGKAARRCGACVFELATRHRSPCGPC